MLESGTQSPMVNRSPNYPESPTIYRMVAERAEMLLSEQEPLLNQTCRALLASDRHVLSERPATLWPVVVIRSCAAAKGDWRMALWPATALEIAMTAADAFDDVADGEETEPITKFGRDVVLTAAVGLLSLAGSAILRAPEDGCAGSVALRLGRLLGEGIATAADGQARGLSQRTAVSDVVEAYRLTAGKSGPLGDLAARLGSAIVATDSHVLDLYGTFGWHFAVSGQLINDALDAAPDGSPIKQDVRVGSPTVPLVFAGSAGAPDGMDADALAAWEEFERKRVAGEGGIILTEVLAIADRLRAEQALAALDELGHETRGLRDLLDGSNQDG